MMRRGSVSGSPSVVAGPAGTMDAILFGGSNHFLQVGERGSMAGHVWGVWGHVGPQRITMAPQGLIATPGCGIGA